MLTEEISLQHLFVEVANSLKLSEAVELIPGPYEIIRSVQGSFNQGNVAVFGEIACSQYACNALYALCWSGVHDIYTV